MNIKELLSEILVKDKADKWLDTKMVEFGNKSANQLIKSGKEDIVINFINYVRTGDGKYSKLVDQHEVVYGD